MRRPAGYRGFTASLLVLGLGLADMPTARAQGPAPIAAQGAQLATGGPRRARRPPLDPAARELRTTRGILAGGIVLTAVCGAGFGLATYAAIDAGPRLQGASGGRVLGAAGAMLACTIAAVAAIGVSGKRLRHLRGRVAWTGGLGLRF